MISTLAFNCVRASPSRRRIQAAVEALEARLVLSSIVVNTVLDQADPPSSSTVSLRDAVTRADQSSGPATISFNPTVFARPQTITLENSGLELSNTNASITINGPAAGVNIAGEGWTVDSDVTASLSGLSTAGITNNGNLTIHDSTITNGSLTGGGINNSGTLVLQNSTVSGNGGYSYRSGLYNSGTATVTGCTFVDNNVVPISVPGIVIHRAADNAGTPGKIRPDLGPGNSYGGAIANTGTLTLTDSTLSGNDAGYGGAIFNTGSAVVSDTTITANYQQVDNRSGTLTLANSIVADNTLSPSHPDVIGAIKSPGHNFIAQIDSASSGWNATDLTGTDADPLDPKLSPLGYYGGPTQTQFPLAGSPVLKAGSAALVPVGVTGDQRGFPRVVGGKVDIGAVELANTSVVTVTPPAPQSVVAGVAASVKLGSFTDSGGKGPFTVEVDWGDGSPDSSFPVSAAGSLGSQTHAFTDTGSLKGTITVVDGVGDVSQLATLAVSSAVAPAQTFTVNTTANQTDPAGGKTVSLLDAVNRADASYGPVTIEFDPRVFAAAQTITLNSSLNLDADVFAPITLAAPAVGVTVAGAQIVFAAGVNASMSRFTSTCGIDNSGTLAVYGSVVSGATTSYGGIENLGKMTLTDSTVSGNTASPVPGRFSGYFYGGSGGGIYSTGSLTVVDSTIARNTAKGDGGGIFNSGSLTLENSTVSDNHASYGAGIENSYNAAATITNSTVSGNSANSGAGGIDNRSTVPVAIADTIVAGNTGAAGPPDVSGTVKSLGHNLIGNTTGSSGWIPSDLTGSPGKPVKADLAPLGNYGGPTPTQFPLAGSPAVGAGSAALLPAGMTTDQRGFARVVGGKIDIGAVEPQNASVVTVTPPAAQAIVGGAVATIQLGSFTDPGGKGPFTVDVNWGDGSPDTVFSVGSAGSLGPQTHAFIATGTLETTVVVSDASGDVSQPAGFSITSPSAPIAGTVFDDANGDGVQDNGEAGLAGVLVYADLGNVGYFVTGDPATTTNAAGAYTLSGLSPGAYVIRQVLPPGYVQTAPSGGLGHHVTVSALTVTGQNFGDKAAAASTITGTVFNDANGDGIQDNGETGLAGIQVYLDLGNVGYFVTGDPTTATNAAGFYTLSGLSPGNYIVRQVVPSDYFQTFPFGSLGRHVTVAAGQTLAAQNFGDEVSG